MVNLAAGRQGIVTESLSASFSDISLESTSVRILTPFVMGSSEEYTEAESSEQVEVEQAGDFYGKCSHSDSRRSWFTALTLPSKHQKLRSPPCHAEPAGGCARDRELLHNGMMHQMCTGNLKTSLCWDARQKQLSFCLRQFVESERKVELKYKVS